MPGEPAVPIASPGNWSLCPARLSQRQRDAL